MFSACSTPAVSPVLTGGTGTGKTHLATALGIEAVTRYGKRVRFYSTNSSMRFRHISDTAKARIKSREQHIAEVSTD